MGNHQGINRTVPLFISSLLLTLCLGNILGCSSTTLEENAAAKIIGEHGLQPSQFSRPRAVAFFNDERFMVIDRTGRVQRFDGDGNYEMLFRLPSFDNGTPTGISIDPTDDSMWIADTHNQRILQYNAEGELLFTFGVDGTGPGQLIFPTDVCPDPDGKSLWISEYGLRSRVMQFTREGEFVKEWGSGEYEYSDLMRPMAIVVDSTGKIFIADAGNHRILVYNRAGERLAVIGNPGRKPGEFKYPYDLALDAEERLYVLEYGNDRVSCFTISGEPTSDEFGKFVDSWGTSGYQPNQVHSPWGLAISKSGIMAIADTYNGRVLLMPNAPAQFTAKEENHS